MPYRRQACGRRQSQLSLLNLPDQPATTQTLLHCVAVATTVQHAAGVTAPTRKGSAHPHPHEPSPNQQGLACWHPGKQGSPGHHTVRPVQTNDTLILCTLIPTPPVTTRSPRHPQNRADPTRQHQAPHPVHKRACRPPPLRIPCVACAQRQRQYKNTQFACPCLMPYASCPMPAQQQQLMRPTQLPGSTSA